MSEKELEEFNSVAKRLGNRFAESYKFGLYDRDDIYQEIALMCWEAYSRWDKVRSLYKFLLSHVANRLKNLKRNKWYRPTCPCKRCDKCKDGETNHRNKKYCKKFLKWKNTNNAKCNLAAPPSIDDSYDSLTENPPDFNMISNELINLLDMEMPISIRSTYLKMKNGVSVKSIDKQLVLDFLHEFMEKYN